MHRSSSHLRFIPGLPGPARSTMLTGPRFEARPGEHARPQGGRASLGSSAGNSPEAWPGQPGPSAADIRSMWPALASPPAILHVVLAGAPGSLSSNQARYCGRLSAEIGLHEVLGQAPSIGAPRFWHSECLGPGQGRSLPVPGRCRKAGRPGPGRARPRRESAAASVVQTSIGAGGAAGQGRPPDNAGDVDACAAIALRSDTP